VGANFDRHFGIESKPILKKNGLLFLRQQNASGENLHLEITNCDHLAKLKFSPVLPNAFTPLEIMPRCSLRARLRPGRAHAPEGGSSKPEAGPAAATGLDFRIIPGSAPEGGVYPV